MAIALKPESHIEFQPVFEIIWTDLCHTWSANQTQYYHYLPLNVFQGSQTTGTEVQIENEMRGKHHSECSDEVRNCTGQNMAAYSHVKAVARFNIST